MKKFLTILAVAGVFAACNSGENKDAAADTTKKDTMVTTAPVDTAKKDTVQVVPADTTKKAK